MNKRLSDLAKRLAAEAHAKDDEPKTAEKIEMHPGLEQRRREARSKLASVKRRLEPLNKQYKELRQEVLDLHVDCPGEYEEITIRKSKRMKLDMDAMEADGIDLSKYRTIEVTNYSIWSPKKK